MFRQLIRQIAVLVNRNVFAKVSEDATKNQVWIVKGLHNQDKEIEVFELYGLSTSPPDKAELLRFALNGHEEHSIALGATGGSFRPRKLLQGEVQLYSQFGQYLKMLEEKQGINLQSGNNSVTLDNSKASMSVGGNSFLLDADKFQVTIGGNTFTMTSAGITSDKDGEFDGISVSTHTHHPITKLPI